MKGADIPKTFIKSNNFSNSPINHCIENSAITVIEGIFKPTI